MGSQPAVDTYPAVSGSLAQLRADVRAFAAREGIDRRAAAAAQAASEAAANAVVHGYGGDDPDARIEVEATRDGEGLTVTVADHGGGLHPRRNSPGLGLGLAIIAQLADELQMREGHDGGIVVWMRFG